MEKRKWIAVLCVAIVVVIAAGVTLGVTHLVLVGGQFYPKNSPVMDLTGQMLSQEDFDTLSRKLPECYIVWNIPFQGGSLSSATTNLTVTNLTEEDVAMLDYATALQNVDGWNCTDYAQLAQLQQRHPNAMVRYHMTISGQECDQSTSQLALEGLSREDGEKLSYLPELTRVTVSGCTDYPFLQQLQQEHPQWNLCYTVALGREEYAWDSETIQAEDATLEQLEAAMSALPQLKKLTLVNPQAEGEALLALREQYAQVEIDWQVEIYGQVVSSEARELDLSGIEVDSCEEVERLVTCLPNLEKLIMSDCGIDSATMAEFRERQRENYKVVWTVYLGKKCKLRTDDIYFMPTQQGEYYFQDSYAEELKYCEDIICMDLGHHTIHNIEFVNYMPHLKYLVLAHTEVKDISPLANCKELVFLELDWSIAEDYTPLLECTALEDLNLGKLWGSEEPIAKMTWLKNLWWMDANSRKRAVLTEALPNTTLMFNPDRTVGNGWRKLQNYYDMRDILGMEYMS